MPSFAVQAVCVNWLITLLGLAALNGIGKTTHATSHAQTIRTPAPIRTFDDAIMRLEKT